MPAESSAVQGFPSYKARIPTKNSQTEPTPQQPLESTSWAQEVFHPLHKPRKKGPSQMHEKPVSDIRQLAVLNNRLGTSKPPTWNKKIFRPIQNLWAKPLNQLGGIPTTECSLFLDYSSYVPFQNAYEAFRNKHWVLGICMLISTALSPSLASLSAAVLTTASVQSNSTIPLTANYFFNDSVMVSNTSLHPAFDIVSATRIYGGNPPPWTTETYAFLPFTSASNSASGNITAENMGYSVQLDYAIIAPDSYQAVTSAVTETALEIQLSFDDRDCINTPSLRVLPGTPMYMQSWANTTCSPSS